MQQPLTVVLWLWAKGWRASMYTAEHVNAAARMIGAHLSLPHRVLCLTDMPKGITACEVMPIWPEFPGLVTAGIPNCWRRIKLFEPETAATIGQRIVSMDLDCVVMRDLAPLFNHAEPFKILYGAYAGYNGSLWQMSAGVHPHVWRKFNPATSPTITRRSVMANGKRRIGSDQAWLAMQVPDAPMWTHKDGVLAYRANACSFRAHREAKLWFFAGGIKPWSRQTREVLPAVYEQYLEHWRGPELPR
jgi:hypothetical protein